ncbi:hypothetical protein JCM14469_41790 [Desulfatiferula olefinivorans]
MEQIKRFSGQSLALLVVMAVVMTLVLDYLLYLGIGLVAIKAGEAAALAEGLTFAEGLAQYLFLKPWFLKVFVPGSLAVALVFTLITWLGLRAAAKKALAGTVSAAVPKKAGAPDAEEALIEENARKRLFLHLIAVLQKEGRLLDFFNEKLDQYDDDQIGAAVRQIHENCAKALSRYLSLSPIIETSEGDTVTVPPGFDPAEIRLTGKVVGNPPFDGTLRHKGWKVDKLEIPTLSRQDNPAVLAPAEVDIE